MRWRMWGIISRICGSRRIKQNWPLANYYLDETLSHLRWAVRIHPVRKTKAGGGGGSI